VEPYQYGSTWIRIRNNAKNHGEIKEKFAKSRGKKVKLHRKTAMTCKIVETVYRLPEPQVQQGRGGGGIGYLPALLKSFFMGILEVVGLDPFGLVAAASSWLFGSGILLVEDGILGILTTVVTSQKKLLLRGHNEGTRHLNRSMNSSWLCNRNH